MQDKKKQKNNEGQRRKEDREKMKWVLFRLQAEEEQ